MVGFVVCVDIKKEGIQISTQCHLISLNPIKIIIFFHILCLYIDTVICRAEQQKYYPLFSGVICSDMLADTIFDTGG